MIGHVELWGICKRRPDDYEPYGFARRESGDCSCGCRFYLKLGDPVLSSDWGVCANPASHRAGLLTFEHQGCLKFEGGGE